MSNIAKIVGERIRKYRIQSGYSQEMLAEKAGLHNTYIGQLERGEKNATLESVEKVANALEVPLEELMEKILIFGDSSESITKFCRLLDPLSLSERESLYKILKEIIDYKNRV